MNLIWLNLKNKLLSEALYYYISTKAHNLYEITTHIENKAPNIIIFDPPSLKETKPEDFPSSAKILLDTGLLEQELIFIILYYRLAGVFEANTSPELIFKCIEVVLKGDLWISKNITKNLFNGLPYISREKIRHLTPKEIEIIKLIQEGYSNSKIARVLSLSEHTIKCHVNRIFKKLGVNSRAQLIKLCHENRALIPNIPPTSSIKMDNSTPLPRRILKIKKSET